MTPYRQQGRHLAECKLDGTDDAPDHGISEQGTKWTAGLDCSAETEEEAGADGASYAEHAQVALGQAPLEIVQLCRRDKIAIVVVDIGPVNAFFEGAAAAAPAPAAAAVGMMMPRYQAARVAVDGTGLDGHQSRGLPRARRLRHDVLVLVLVLLRVAVLSHGWLRLTNDGCETPRPDRPERMGLGDPAGEPRFCVLFRLLRHRRRDNVGRRDYVTPVLRTSHSSQNLA